jgi:2'-5' RNA ligase
MEKEKTVESKRRLYGCLMAALTIKGWSKLHALIDPEDIYGTKEEGFGKETNPHVTVLFGFHDSPDVAEKLQALLPTTGPIEVPLVRLSHFETPNYDVVKFEVVSEDLKRLNKWCAEHFPYTSEYAYNPHVTLCYVKKGTGKKYDREMREPATCLTDKLVYSRPDRTKTKWTIEKEKAS